MNNSYSKKRNEIYNFYNRYIDQINSLINDLPSSRNFHKLNNKKNTNNLKISLQKEYNNKSISDIQFTIFLKKDFQNSLNILYQSLYNLLNKICIQFKDNIELQDLERRYQTLINNYNQKIQQQRYQTHSYNPSQNYFRRRSFGGNQSKNLSLSELKTKIESIKKDKSRDYDRIMSFLKRNIVIFIEFKKYLDNKNLKLPCFNNNQYLFPIESNYSNVLDVYYTYLENLQNSKNQQNIEIKDYIKIKNLMKEIEIDTNSYYNKSNLNKKLNSNSNNDVLNSNKLKSSNIENIYKYMNTYKDFKKLLTKEDILNFDKILNNKDKYNKEELQKYIMSLLKKYNEKLKSLKKEYTFYSSEKNKKLLN